MCNSPLVSILLMLAMSLPASAQQPVFFNYSVEHGLTSTETYNIIQDSKGFIWVATDRGVNRFDGYKFTGFTTQEGLTDNTVFDIYEDAKGRIWFITFNGKLCYYYKGKIFPYEYNASIEKAVQGTRMGRSFYVDTMDNVTIGYLNNDILTINSKGEYRLVKVPVDTSYCRSGFAWEVNGIKMIGSSVSGNIKGKECFITNITGKQQNFDVNDRNSLTSVRMAKRKNGSYVVITSKHVFSISSSSAEQILYSREVILNNVYEDADSCIWIGTRKRGVRRYEPNMQPGPDGFETLLDGQTVTAILQDNENGYWFATLESGVFYMPSLAFRTMTNPIRSDNYVVGAISGDGENVYAGFNNGFVYRIQGEKVVETINVNNGTDSSDYVQALFCDPHTGLLWTGTSRLLRAISDMRTVMTFNLPTRAILPLEGGKMLIGGQNLFFLDAEGGMQPALRVNGLIRTDALYGDDRSTWLGSAEGLFSVDEGLLVKDTAAMLQVRVVDIKRGGGDMVVLATLGNGVILKNGDRMTRISIEEGLASNIVNSVFVNGSRVWAGTNKGISCITLAGGKVAGIRNINTFHGLPTNEIKKIFMQNDTLWLGTGKGLAYFIPSEVKPNISNPFVYIDKIQVNNETHDSTINELSYRENHIWISFIGLSYRMRGNVGYRYRLKGLNDDWRYTQGTSVSFAAVPPGEYTFEVQAQNEEGTFSPKTASFSFTIASPFWMRWWFLAACVAGVFSLFYWRLGQIRQKNVLVNRLTEYQQQALSAQINPHFIFNSLYSIQSFVLKEDRISASKYLNSFSRLMRKSLDHSRRRFVTLKEELDLLNAYLELEMMRFKNKFTCGIDVSGDIEKEEVLIPTMLLQPYIENAILHGVIPREGNDGRIMISILKEGKVMKCNIEDNGIGRERSLQRERVVHSSHGTNMTEERLRIICRQLRQDFFLKIVDKTGAGGEAMGTQIIFNLPYINKHDDVPESSDHR